MSEGRVATTPVRLPTYHDAFIGRDDDLDALQTALQHHRLVTLTGGGGVGKTRLAVETAHRLLLEYPDGVWLVRLSELRGAVGLTDALAERIGVGGSRARAVVVATEAPRELIEEIAGHLEHRRGLLILDHCEHALGAVAEVASTLSNRCADLTILTTSLQPLRVAGEHLRQVPPLEVPEGRDHPEAIARNESVLLFADRAQATRPDFTLTEETLPLVAEICRTLEGNPLAIELAAARVGVLDVRQIAERLEDQFRLLTGGDAGRSGDHHATLRAIVDTSYELLSPEERTAFARMSVFPATFTLEAAEAVVSGPDLPAASVLDLVAGLISKSILLVVAGGGEHRRYRLPTALRRYGQERLEERSEAGERRDRHAEHFAALAAATVPELRGPRQIAALNRLEAEDRNLRAALDHAIDTGDVNTAQALVGTLYWYWFVRWDSAALGLARRALGMQGEVQPAVHASALVGTGLLTGVSGAGDEANELLTQAAAIYRELGNAVGEGEAHLYAGIGAQARGRSESSDRELHRAAEVFSGAGIDLGVAWARWFQTTNAERRGEIDEALRLAEEAIRGFRAAGDAFGLANGMASLGTLHRRRGRVDRAVQLHAEAVATFREIGDRGRTAAALGSLAIDERERGNLDRSIELLTEGLAIATEVGATPAVAEAHYLMGESLRRSGDLRGAEEHFRDALETASRSPGSEARSTAILAIEGLAVVAAETGRYERLVRLIAAGSRQREETRLPPSGDRRRAHQALLMTARRQLGAARYQELWDGGRRMDRRQSLEAALGTGEPRESVLSLEQVELGERVARQLDAVADRLEVRVAGIRFKGRRRRPTGERPPLPIQLRASGRLWLLLGISVVAVWISLFLWPDTSEWWDNRDRSVLVWMLDRRTAWLTTLAQALHALGQAWTWRPLRWLTLAALAATRRWRHFFVALLAFLLLEVIVNAVVVTIARPRPPLDAIGSWTGYSHPSAEVASLSATLAVIGLSLIPRGRWRTAWMWLSAVAVAVLVGSRLYLGVERLSDGVVGAVFGLAIAIVLFRVLVPESIFPVAFRRGRTAHLDVTGRRGRAITQATADQLGITVKEITPFGLAGSGGSTPLRLTVEGDPDTHLFAKLYARSHLRADRWYKLGRTILYGALEDEVRFTSVRRLVEYEDYLLLTMRKAQIPSAEPYGIVEITPDREYLIVTEFLADAVEIGDLEADDPVMDSALLVVRRLWDEGLAHRDIKPANIMVRDERVRLIDVAFATIRPTPWRQAVDLANMLLVLAVNTDPARVYERALQYFAPEDIAEAFAATRGITMPRQLSTAIKRRLQDTGVDLIEEFRALAPPAEPIRVQRWSLRRFGLALGAALAAFILLAFVIENASGRGFL
jgi:predicted ATPase/membrane-associated phospholipid phosphatase